MKRPRWIKLLHKNKKEIFLDLFRRLTLQMIDMLWVEHLEVMSFTRSSVSLRAYGQRDPLTEYRKEGTRLFKEMQEVVIDRIADILPNLQPQVVVKEETVRKQEAAVAQAAAGQTTTQSKGKQTPVVKDSEYGRNDLVVISDGTQTMEMKYKKAEPLLSKGWVITQPK
jgi:preprotein translocase subunit SecA